MTVLNTADDLFLGTAPVDVVYLGSTQVWPPPPFSPSSVPGLLSWLDAQSLVLTDGAVVGPWPDMSGTGHDAVPVEGAVTYAADGVNGHPSVRFGEQTRSGLRIDLTAPLGDRTIFQVFQTLSSSWGIYHTTQVQELDPYTQTYGPPGATIHTYTTPDVDSGVPWSGQPQFVTLWTDITQQAQSLTVDGHTVNAGYGPAITSSTAPIHVGSLQPAAYGMNGWIAEMIFYDRHLSDAEIGQVQDYLAAKWAPQSASSWDDDTQAFLDASGLDESYAPALDGLVRGLKDAGLWAKMTAVYPFIGGTADLHKWNLIDPRDADDAFRLGFWDRGTMSHSDALGYRPNAQGQGIGGGYADTYLVPSARLLDVNSTHVAHYGLLDVPPGDRAEIGNFGWNGANARFHVISRYVGVDGFYYGQSENGQTMVTVPGASGLFVATRTSAEMQSGYRNGVLQGQSAALPTAGLPTTSVLVGAINGFANASDVPCGFASIGSGLSAQDVAALNTVVEEYQDALGRARRSGLRRTFRAWLPGSIRRRISSRTASGSRPTSSTPPTGWGSPGSAHHPALSPSSGPGRSRTSSSRARGTSSTTPGMQGRSG